MTRAGLAMAILAVSWLSAPSVTAADKATVAQTTTATPARQVFAPGLPLKRDTDSEGVGTGTAALAAAAVLLIAVWAAVQYRHRQRGTMRSPGTPSFPWLGQLLPRTTGRQLRVIETASLTTHARLHVVAWQGQEYLVSTALDQVSILDRREIRSTLPAGDAQGGLEEAE